MDSHFSYSKMCPPIDPRSGSTQLTSKTVVQLHVGFGVDVDGAEPEDVDGQKTVALLRRVPLHREARVVVGVNALQAGGGGLYRGE